MTIMPSLQDGFGRRFPYLRLSVTDVCNFRCTYCLPDGYQKVGPRGFLSVEEIQRLVTGFARLGMTKIRLTGGEPTVRADFTQIARTVAAIPGIAKVAFTTNGYRLAQHAREWRDAGLTAVNVSIDSLDAATFHAVTGHDRLHEVLAGVDACRAVGFEAVKINAVLLKGVNDHSLPDFVAYARDRRVSLRFIELMETGLTRDYFQAHHLSGDVVVRYLTDRGWALLPREADAGPAQVFGHTDHAGTIGLIAPYSRDFCSTCNRLRVTARGRLRLCLFGDGGFDLRPFLQDDDGIDHLVDQIRQQLGFKRDAHRLHQGDPGATPHLASVGG